MPLGKLQQVIVTSADGTKQRFLPTTWITGATGRIERYGLYSQFQINTVVPFTSTALSNILKGDRVEFHYAGIVRFRGWIEERMRTEGDPDTLAFVGYGMSFLMGQQLCQGRFAYVGSGVDIAAAFADIVRSATLPLNQVYPAALGRQGLPIYESLLASTVGTSTTFVDGYQKLFRDVANDLVQNQAGNLAFWGSDVDAYGQDRLRIGPLAPLTRPATHVLLVPALQTEAASGEDQAGDLKNRVLLSGTNAIYPQKLHNGDFSLPLVFQAGDNGLIKDGSFEYQLWTLGGGASYKDGGHQEGQPYAGNWMVELDHAGENVSVSDNFIVAPTTGDYYTFSIRSKKELSSQVANGSGYLQIKNSGGAVIYTANLTLNPVSTNWDYFSTTFTMPAGATSYYVHFECDAITALGGDQGGLLIDACSLDNASVIYQDGWQVNSFGSASFNAVKWDYRDCSFDGIYAFYCNVTATNTDGQDAHLEPLNRATIPILFKQGLTMAFRYRSPLVQTGSLAIPEMHLHLDYYRSDGSYIGWYGSVIAAQAVNGTWQYAATTQASPGDAASVVPTILFRSNGEVLIDCISVQDAEAVAAGDVPTMPDGNPGYTPEGNLRVFQTAAASGLGGAYASSEAIYGSRVAINNQGDVSTLAGLTQVANAQLRATAIPMARPHITRIEDPAVYMPGDSLDLQGALGPALSGGNVLSIVAVELAFGDLFTATIEVDKEAPSPTLIAKQLILDQLQANGPGGSSGSGSGGAGYSNPTSLGGSTGGGSAGVTVQDGAGDTFSSSSTIVFTNMTASAGATTGTVDVAAPVFRIRDRDTFAVSGRTYTLSQTPNGVMFQVFFDGVLQPPTMYSYAATAFTLAGSVNLSAIATITLIYSY